MTKDSKKDSETPVAPVVKSEETVQDKPSAESGTVESSPGNTEQTAVTPPAHQPAPRRRRSRAHNDPRQKRGRAEEKAVDAEQSAPTVIEGKVKEEVSE